MIKGIILDVDGVIVGGKKGFNWPYPHPDILHAFKTLRKQGIIISLCTGKGTFAIKNIVDSAHLDNLHIGDGGAIIFDFINNRLFSKQLVPNEIGVEIVKLLSKQKIYTELYTVYEYYVEKNQKSDITKKHSAILYQEPKLIRSLIDHAHLSEIVKVMPIAKDEKEKEKVIKLLMPYKNLISIQWGVHPSAYPLQFGIVTAKNISKKSAAMTVAEHYQMPFETILGIGDGITDWAFMQLCRYVGVMGNASEDLKEIAVSKEDKNCIIGPTVDENGVLGILKYFRLM